MATFNELIILSAVMGMSIFLSLPIVLKKAMGSKTVALLNAGAIGILVFLVADVYSNAAVIIFPSGYVGDATAMALFLVGFLVSFFFLFGMARPSPNAQTSPPNSVALIIAVAIGFQNLTEGLVFGASWALGLSGVLLVIFAGFFLQNVTEGFPICAPYLGSDRPPLRRLAGYFLIGGLPTIGGGIFGYYWNSNYLDVFFDALAIGAITYALLPMIKAAFRPATNPPETRLRQDMMYVGLAVGFAVGFLVNAF
jgi:zinc transporter, ZIP family